MVIEKMFVHFKYFRKLVIKFYASKEGGVFRFQTLRYLYKKYKNIEVGYGSYRWTTELIDGPAVIGKYTSIGKNVIRICVNHPLSYVTTHTCTFNLVFGWLQKNPREKS